MIIGYIIIGTIAMIIRFVLIKNPTFWYKLELKINPLYFPTKSFKEYTKTPHYSYIMKGFGYLILLIGFALIIAGITGFNISNIIPKKTN